MICLTCFCHTVKLEWESKVGWKQLSTLFDIIFTVIRTILTCVPLSLTCTMLSMKLNVPVFFVNLNATSLGYTPGYDGVINIHLTSNYRLFGFSVQQGVQLGDPLGPLLFSLVLLDFMNSIDVPTDISLKLWYLDDGTFAGTRPAVAELLELFRNHGPSFGLALNLKKCEIFWPRWRHCFSGFPSRSLPSSPNLQWHGFTRGSYFWKF